MPNTKDKKVVTMIRSARIRNCLSQDQLAQRLGVSQSYISKLENRRTKAVSIEFVLKLSKNLKICPVALFIFLTSDCCSRCHLNCLFCLKNK